MICTKCGKQQIGGVFCTQCGSKLKSGDDKVTLKLHEHDQKPGARSAPDQPSEDTATTPFTPRKRGFFSRKGPDLPPPPEMVKRKFREKERFRLKGFGLILFWISNLIMRSIESVLFCAAFQITIWGLLQIGNFFGGMVAPEAEIKYSLLIIDRTSPHIWEYIAFGIITILTFRRRWGI